MIDAFICDYIRTPFGRFGGALSGVRADDLGAVPMAALMERNPSGDWEAVDDVFYGCANQAGEHNRNVGRMAVLLAGLVLHSVLGWTWADPVAALGIAAAAQWLANFAISTSFPVMADLGLGFAYGFYTLCAILSFFFVLKWVPETKGRELEDMD